MIVILSDIQWAALCSLVADRRNALIPAREWKGSDGDSTDVDELLQVLMEAEEQTSRNDV